MWHNCRWHHVDFNSSFFKQKAVISALLILQYCSQFSEQRPFSQLRSRTHHGHGQQSKQKCWGTARTLWSPFPVPVSRPSVLRKRYRISLYSCWEGVPRFRQPYHDLLSMMLTPLSLAETDMHWAQALSAAGSKLVQWVICQFCLSNCFC